ncbi:MAG: hypothetical protein ABIO38_07500, partial [Luteimonas sp.]
MTSETTTRRRRSVPIQDTEQRALDPMQELLAAMHAVANGDFSVHLPLHWDGVAGKLAETFNEIVLANRRLCHDLARVGDKVGREGQTRQRLAPANRQGAWA